MKEQTLLIVKELLNLEYFNLELYYDYINKYGKGNVIKAFSYILKENNDDDIIIDKFFDAFFSIELENMRITNRTYNTLINKYGKDRIDFFFINFFAINGNNPNINKKYELIASHINAEDDSNDLSVSDDSVKQYLMSLDFPVLSPKEEKQAFTFLGYCRDEITIANFDENDNIFFDNFEKLVKSISTTSQLKNLYRIRDYLSDDDKIIYSKYYAYLKNCLKNNIPVISENDNVYRDAYVEGQLMKISHFFKLRDKIIKSNLKLVVYVARRYHCVNMNLLDLIQEGNMGLLTAVKKFDVRKGTKFSTYATWWIRQVISRAIACQERTIRVPVNEDLKIQKVNRAINDLNASLGYEPSDLELAEYLGYPLETVVNIKNNLTVTNITSLDVNLRDDDSSLINLVADPNSDCYELACKNELKELSEELMSVLTAREALVLKLRFGLETGNVRTLESVGQEFGVTRERIRQIESKALRKLRNPSRLKKINDYRN